MTKQVFPKTIHVVQNGEGDDAFLMVVDVEKDDLHEYDGQAVATYGKALIGTLRVTQEIVE